MIKHALSYGVIAAGLSLAGANAAQATEEPASLFDNIDVSGQIALEARWFPEDAQFDNQFDGTQLSGLIEPEFRYESDDRNNQLTFIPFFRLDSEDDNRTHGDVREAYWRHFGEDWEFTIGANRVFWGVTESRHLVNIINQIDAVENIDEEDFLGQPMFQLSRQTDVGLFDLYLMSGFRERTFADDEGRLRGPLPVDDDAARYTNSLNRYRPEVALRYSHYVGDVDIGLHIFHGIGREPDLIVAPNGRKLIPEYSLINQTGADLQYTKDAWLWKLEALVREGQGDTFAATVAGVEYTLYQILESNADLGLLAEVLYDGRDDDVFQTAFDQDGFFGARITLNDIQDTAFLGGMVIDADDGLGSVRLEAGRRVGDSWKVELEGQAFLESENDAPGAVFQDDSFITLRMSYFF